LISSVVLLWRVVIVRVTLIAAPVLCVLHIVLHLAFDLQLRDSDCQDGVEALLCVRFHVQLSVDKLTFVYTERFRQQQTSLIPVGGWVFGAGMQDAVMVVSAKDGVEVNRVAMQDSRLGDFVLERDLHVLEILQRAVLEVKRLAEWFIR
jgi:hypothetical protein